jgi:hypothetical protein
MRYEFEEKEDRLWMYIFYQSKNSTTDGYSPATEAISFSISERGYDYAYNMVVSKAKEHFDLPELKLKQLACHCPAHGEPDIQQSYSPLFFCGGMLIGVLIMAFIGVF